MGEQKFVVVIEHLTSQGEVVGMFDHKEEAETWAKDNVRHSIWRVADYTDKADKQRG